MSLRATTWASQQQLPPGLRWVLFWLADHASTDGTGAWPSKNRLASLCQTDVATIRKQLRQLELGGFIVRGDQRSAAHIPNNRRPVVYDMNLWRGMSGDRVIQGTIPEDQGGPQDPSPGEDSGPLQSARGVLSSPPGGSSGPPNQELEPVEPTHLASQVQTARAGRSTDPVEPAAAIEHIRSIRQTITKGKSQ